MKILAILFLGLSFVQAEWIDLFDGKTTDGWTPRNKVINFEAKDGELHLLSKTNVWVTTKVEMADFEAELEVLLPDYQGFNSGLAFRCQGAKGKPKGYQIEIDRKIPGGVYGIGLGGWLSEKKGTLKEGEWNHFRVKAEGDRIQTWVNGEAVSDIRNEKQLKGYFGIQHHGKGETVKFRKIRVRGLTKKETTSLERPNILWIVAEDMSPTLGCYGDPDARTPHIDALAKESLLFTHAFAAYPVCAPSRSCLISGLYPTSTGTGQMRSAHPLPAGTRGFPEYLREAGYYTTNNVKTDYNSADAPRLVKDCWDESSPTAHWKNRKEGQPFFAVFNDMTSHQSRTMVWPHEDFQKHIQSKLSPGEIHDPAKVRVPPYYPDTPGVRKTVARYHDCVSVMDQNVGRLLKELDEAGLAEDTIVFFYSDHGSGMPRHKRVLTDSGMRVPLLVRVPKKWQHLAPAKPGTKTDRLVSFIDFPPTVLDLAGVKPPKTMSNHRVIGYSLEREWIYGARDRVDEVFDCARSVRNGRWLLIRNYFPHYGWNQNSVFSDLGDIRKELANFSKNTKRMNAPQNHYLSGRRAPFEFYDCKNDPENLTNLWTEDMSDEQALAFKDAQKALEQLRQETHDVGFLPEGIMDDLIQENGKAIGDQKPDMTGIWKLADSVGQGLELAAKSTSSKNPAERFWSIISLRAPIVLGTLPHEHIAPLLDDPVDEIRIEAASWLVSFDDHHEKAFEILIKELDNPTWCVALRACRAIELLGEAGKPALPAMKKLYDRTRNSPGDENFFLAFSSGAFLDKLGEKTTPWDFTPGAGSFMPTKKK
ncbi:MAG: sulfatase-like hydrolase/transferase [Akkermansiaceae bacterium]